MKFIETESLPALAEAGGANLIASAEKTVAEQAETGPIAAFRGALGQAFMELAAKGARPPELYQMTMALPDLEQFRASLLDYDLAFREVLAGNFPEIYVTQDASLAGPRIALSANLDPPDPAAAVYERFTQTELDFQYSPRQQTKDPERYFVHWRVAGPAYQQRRAAEIWFGETPGQSIDLFLPEEAEDPPLHLFIHGGYWQALDKRNHAHMADALLKAGIAVGMVNYDLMPETDLTEILRQCRAAVAKAHGLAETYGYDASRLTVSGHSAGGHLAGAMVCTDWPAFQPGLPADLVKAAVPISGLFDLEPLSKTGMNRVFRFSAAYIADLSPVTMQPGPAVPVLLSVGGEESEEFHRQSAVFAAHLRRHGFSVDEVAMPGHNHFSIVEALTDPNAPLTAAIIRTIAAL